MNKYLKRMVNGVGLHVSSLKSQQGRENYLEEVQRQRDSYVAERDRLANECDRLANECERLTNDLGQSFHEIERYISLMADTDRFFDLLLTENGRGFRKAQINQDILALAVNGFKRDGFFVEFGATNGLDLSNTYLLEKHFAWKGILAEPATVWHEELRRNRNCHIDTDCVWSISGETLDFDIVREGEFSTISSFSKRDNHAARREDKTTSRVSTISLVDLLQKYSAPKNIDYISLDTEGSEYEILKDFDFSTYRFNLITVEHNYTDCREKLKHLLESHGYHRILDHMSRWDDWYTPIHS